jgi:restriction system protein
MGGDAPDKPDRSVRSVRLDGSDGSDGEGRRRMLRPSGGYRGLRSYQATPVIYDATVSFCERFVDKRSRTVDQMVQAARSGRQNIAEGSRASATSSQTELRLVNVARAGLDELLLDYEDFLRQRGLRAIGRSRPAERMDQADPTAEYAGWLKHTDPAVVANTVICLIHQAAYLLDRQILALEQHFIQEGGYSENLAAARRAVRQNQMQGDPGNSPTRPARRCLPRRPVQSAVG